MPTGQGPWIRVAAGVAVDVDRGTRLDQRGLQQVAALQVGRFERVGVAVRVLGRGRQQEPRRLDGLAHPSGGVQPRRDRERDRLEVDGRRFDVGALEDRGDPGTGRGAKDRQPEAGDRPVLADDRRDVRDGPDGREIREGQRRGRSAGQVRQERRRRS